MIPWLFCALFLRACAGLIRVCGDVSVQDKPYMRTELLPRSVKELRLYKSSGVCNGSCNALIFF